MNLSNLTVNWTGYYSVNATSLFPSRWSTNSSPQALGIWDRQRTDQQHDGTRRPLCGFTLATATLHISGQRSESLSVLSLSPHLDAGCDRPVVGPQRVDRPELDRIVQQKATLSPCRTHPSFYALLRSIELVFVFLLESLTNSPRFDYRTKEDSVAGSAALITPDSLAPRHSASCCLL